MKTITKQLEEKYGGKWKYIRNRFAGGRWFCKELDAMAYYVAHGGYDVNGEYVPPILQNIFVYGIGVPKRFVPKQSYKKLLNK